jgi:hypothetical protein
MHCAPLVSTATALSGSAFSSMVRAHLVRRGSGAGAQGLGAREASAGSLRAKHELPIGGSEGRAMRLARLWARSNAAAEPGQVAPRAASARAELRDDAPARPPAHTLQPSP